MKIFLTFAIFAAAPMLFAAGEGVEQVGNLMNQHSSNPVMIKGNEGVTTKAKFAPPVEITIIAKTDSTNLRMGYAADQVIFNWEGARGQLRIDGGPANGKHKSGAGAIPTKTYVTIRWVVTPKMQSIYVDGDLRFVDAGDYSHIDNPITVFCHNSKVSIQSIKVLKLPAE